MLVDGLTRAVTKHYKGTIIIIVLATIFFGYYAAQLEISTGNQLYLPDNAEGRAYFELQENFGDIENLYVVVESDTGNVLTRDIMLEIFNLQWEILNRTDHELLTTPDDPSQSMISIVDIIAQALAIYNDNPNPTLAEKYDYIAQLDDASIREAIGLILNTDEISEGDKNTLKSLISRDFVTNGEPDAALVIILFESSLNLDENQEVKDQEVELNEYLMEYSDTSEHLTVYVTGGYLIDHENSRASLESMTQLLPIAFIFLTIILGFTYRNVSDTIISLLAISFTIIWTLAASVLLGFYFTPFHVGVPILIIGLGIDYGIHLLVHYRQELAEGRTITRAMKLTIGAIGAALFLCTLTTVIGFTSNVSSSLRIIREFGLLCAIGIIFSFLLMTTFTVSARVLFDRFRSRRSKPLLSAKMRDRLLERPRTKHGKRSPPGVAGARRFPIVVIGLVVLFTLLAGRSAMFLRTTFDPSDLMYPESPQFKTFEYMGDHFDISSETTSVLIWGDVTDPLIVQRINESQNNMRDDTYVTVLGEIPQVTSLLSTIQKYSRPSTLYYNESFGLQFRQYADRDGDGYIDANVTAEDLHALYTIFYHYYPLDAQLVLHRVVHDDGTISYDGTVMRVKTNSHRFKYLDELEAELLEDVKPLGDASDRYHLTGGPMVTKVIITSIEASQMQSLVIMMLAALTVLMTIFWIFQRSLMLGVLTTLPVLFVIIWTWGSMVLLEIPLNMLTAMMASLSIGIGIDYSIHVTERFVQMLEFWGNIDIALHQAVRETGRVLAGAALTTVGGFGILAFSFMPVIRQFGIILALTIIFATVAAVLVLPAFLLKWARWKLRHGKLDLKPLTKARYDAWYGNNSDVSARGQGHGPPAGTSAAGTSSGASSGASAAGTSAAGASTGGASAGAASHGTAETAR